MANSRIHANSISPVLHAYLDDLDSKLAAVRAALATPSGDDEWSAYSTALGRKFLRLDQFLKSTGAKAEENVPNPKLFP